MAVVAALWAVDVSGVDDDVVRSGLAQLTFWVDDASLNDLRAGLLRLGFVVYETSGCAVTSEKEFLSDLRVSLDLDDYAALNWNAFVSAFGDLVRAESKPIVVLWKNPASAFATDLSRGVRLFGELSSILGDWNIDGPEGHQVELVLVGDRWR